ncbi:aldehyde dehydrogenase family protein [Rhizobium sp. S95]|uniref:Aldehyde dehydrogenase family protein n=1 Tax=Ciceribacter sichuanensis TaxID=2949647 RepID=A0AAJ1C1D1_9HYPH|nr:MULTISPECIES: aldehyde dehydrogenase family protein [unclassified Ciceribacter]MCM2395697.1 aldehyde dehydrogenase family protein [Ciceribacter sp. S95]MCO5959986.1 aldehyde dehydrogenase family protein [Ciceribacter sp. S101]
MKIYNWINNASAAPRSDRWVEKFNPHTGAVMSQFAASDATDVEAGISAATVAFGEWSALTPVKRGQMIGDFVDLLKKHKQELADCIAEETGKPPQDALGELGGAITQGEYFAGEGMRLYARSLTSGTPAKYSHTVRCPLGVAGLIVPANTPAANLAWKIFPALVCGNTAVVKSAEDSPHIAVKFAEIAAEAGLPAGVLNVVHGVGSEAGSCLVEDPRIAIISFTGSTPVGRQIAEKAGRRLARVSLELGGKNPFVVCDDANIENAAHWASLSAFSNAGQRCAAGSKFLVFEKVYDEFRDAFLAKAKTLKLGIAADCNLGPVVSKRQQEKVISLIEGAKVQGGKVLCGGGVPTDDRLAGGYYVEPTIIDGLARDADICRQEIFGPVATLHPVSSMQDALEMANATEYGLTASIHTTSVDRAMWFAQRIRAGVANINGGTYGSEPHMPFGGFGASGNGTREPGAEALDVYSELKNISFFVREGLI